MHRRSIFDGIPFWRTKKLKDENRDMLPMVEVVYDTLTCHQLLIHPNHLEVTDCKLGRGVYSNVYRGVVKDVSTDESVVRIVALKIGLSRYK